MGSESHPLHVLFFPFMAQGHMLPMINIAKLFAARGVRTTIFTTPRNDALIRPSIDRFCKPSHFPIQTFLVPFPTSTGLPEDCENFIDIPTIDFVQDFLEAVKKLRDPFDQAIKELSPHCVISDCFLPWTYDVATKHNIPRLVFHGTNYFNFCAAVSVESYKALGNFSGDSVPFVLPCLPHKIEMLESQILDPTIIQPAFLEIFRQSKICEPKSYGVVVNSFYELEPSYVEHYKKVVGQKAWHIGPVALCNNDDIADKFDRGSVAFTKQDVCLKWLNSKRPNSVIFACFGSVAQFSGAQLQEIALGLEASNHPFIWVVRQGGDADLWMPEGFEERVQGRGLIIKGWAPQMLILNHEAVGGFLTHCGWNSSLEGMSAGVPFATWPLFADQFFNERLIVDVLNVGVPVGNKVHAWDVPKMEVIEAKHIQRAVNRLMSQGEETEERRRRARELKAMAKKATQKGGSSYNDMNELIQELMDRRIDSAGLY